MVSCMDSMDARNPVPTSAASRPAPGRSVGRWSGPDRDRFWRRVGNSYCSWRVAKCAFWKPTRRSPSKRVDSRLGVREHEPCLRWRSVGSSLGIGLTCFAWRFPIESPARLWWKKQNLAVSICLHWFQRLVARPSIGRYFYPHHFYAQRLPRFDRRRPARREVP